MGRQTQAFAAKAKRMAVFLKYLAPLMLTGVGGGAAYFGVTQAAPQPADVKELRETVNKLTDVVVNIDKTMARMDTKLGTIDDSRERDRAELQRQINECVRAIDKLESIGASKQEVAELRRIIGEAMARIAELEKRK